MFQIYKTVDSLEGRMFHLENILSVFLLGATNHVLSFSLVNFQSHPSCSSIQCYCRLLKRFRGSTNNIDIGYLKDRIFFRDVVVSALGKQTCSSA